MTMPGGWELIVILFIVLLLFGARKLPDLAGSMGKSIKEFRKASRGALDDEDEDDNGDTPSSSPSASERDAES